MTGGTGDETPITLLPRNGGIREREKRFHSKIDS